MAKRKLETSHLANRTYSPEDSQKNDPLSAGLAETFEQVMGAYTEGEIGEKLNQRKDQKDDS